MGGRGASIGIKKRIPNIAKITVHDDKIYKYYLNEEKSHYKGFKDVGYTKENGEQLRKDLLDGLKNNPVHEYIRKKLVIKKQLFIWN